MATDLLEQHSLETLERSQPVYSDFRDDEDFRELLVEFVQELPDRAATLTTAFVRGDLAAVKVTAHQLKGSGGGYGFQGLTELAAALETACLLGNPATLGDRLDALLAYLRRIEA